MKQKLFLFAAMGCLGMTTEIFFTAIVQLIDMVEAGDVNLRLMGFSYIWMFPIYGLAGIAFPPIIKRILHLNILIRMCIYAIGILLVEFITGWLLHTVTGQCPWEYKTGWHVMGYIRIDYFPLWALFGTMVELILRYLLRLKS